MNNLEKINALLSKEGRSIVYGRPVTAEAVEVISLSIGEGEDAVNSLGDSGRTTYTTVEIAVYASDYLAGYNLLLAVKSEIARAIKSTVKIAFKRFCESKYDETLSRHVLRSQYKIIE